jgi:hypothetical protein
VASYGANREAGGSGDGCEGDFPQTMHYGSNVGVPHQKNYSEISLRRSSGDPVKMIVLLKHLLRHTSLYILGPGGDGS